MADWSYPIPNHMTNASTYDLHYCNRCCALVFTADTESHDQYHNNHVRRTDSMSNVKWCDKGDHAYKAGEPGSQSFTGTTVDSNGNPVSLSLDACAKHAVMPVPTHDAIEPKS